MTHSITIWPDGHDKPAVTLRDQGKCWIVGTINVEEFNVVAVKWDMMEANQVALDLREKYREHSRVVVLEGYIS